MAGPCACQSPRWNSLPAGKDKLAGAALGASTNSNGTLSHTPTLLPIPTSALALPLAPAEFVAKYTNADLQQATKLALKLFI